MPFALKLPRRNPDAPRPSLRERYAALKGSAAKVIGRQPNPAGIVRPKPPGAGTPSKALAAALAAHEMAYGYALYTEAYGLPDLTERRQAEEEVFRALLHTPLHSDADRAAYAAAVISRQMRSLGDASATERDHPMAVAFRNIALSEHTREPEAMRHVGRPVEPAPDADPILAAIAASQAATAAFDAFEMELERYGKTSGWAARERTLTSADIAAQKVVWQTVPTTPAGRRALVDYARTQVQRRSHDGDVDDSAWLLGLILDAVAAMVDGEGQLLPGETVPARVDAYDHKTGLVTYADAAGTISTRPAAEWIAFMAARLHHVARTERSRQFNAACNDLDEAACAKLDARLTRELRIDAIHALAHRWDEVFTEAQDLRDGREAGVSAKKVDLSRFTVLQLVNLREAYQAARHLWEGIVARPYSADLRDPIGCVDPSAVGRLADFEETRVALIGDRIVDELTNRVPATKIERDYILSVRLQHEIECEGRICDADMMREISQAWEA